MLLNLNLYFDTTPSTCIRSGMYLIAYLCTKKKFGLKILNFHHLNSCYPCY